MTSLRTHNLKTSSGTSKCEFPALARGASRDRFAVLVHAKAPSDVARAPLDLVTVLDVSASMKGQKLELLKQAMCFLIDQLGPADRLSVVTFSRHASRLTRLARMSDAGKASAKITVGALCVLRGTNIGQGLRVGAQVLAGRREKNAVAGMILLSDGHDSSGRWTSVEADGTKGYANLVPSSERPAPPRRSTRSASAPTTTPPRCTPSRRPRVAPSPSSGTRRRSWTRSRAASAGSSRWPCRRRASPSRACTGASGSRKSSPGPRAATWAPTAAPPPSTSASSTTAR
ncbi:unnamed protein product [Miscanthus lutarioriparius]|uniref:VWFA domain-containing protein n=1 Tax=Miscanthus lutarioriparius TaxID=422564 RepID=A0A811NDS9_9POAL|nr:unnamed protein product [Miscanthus lutarioriparius]